MLAGALLVVVAGVIMMTAGAWVVGATWDERTHVLMLQTFLERGWNVTPDALLADGRPDPSYPFGTYVYGPVAELFAHFTNVSLGIEELGSPTYTALSTSGRHLGTALLGIVGIAATAGVVYLVTGSKRYAVIGAALLCSTGMWVGHSMFNIKDLPVATGYTLGTLGVVAFAHPAFRSRHDLRWVGLGALTAGAVLASGTRPAMGAPLVAAAIGTPLVLAVLRSSLSGVQAVREFREALVRMAWAVASLAAAYVSLIAIYPNAYANPVNLAWQTLVVSARFPFNEQVLTAGTWMDQPPTWTYLPLWFGAQLPLLISVFFILGLASWTLGIWRNLRGQISRDGSFQLAMIFAVLMQAALMPILGIALQSTMYNGQRQFLFVLPAVVITATVGIRAGFKIISTRSRKSWLPLAYWVTISIGIIGPTVGQALTFPYNYVYFNTAASAFGINGNWPTDYWRASSNELMRRLPAAGPEVCSYETDRSGQMSACSKEPMFIPYLDQRGDWATYRGTLGEGYWLVRENYGDLTVPNGCEPHAEVTRPLWGERIVISQIFRCSN